MMSAGAAERPLDGSDLSQAGAWVKRQLLWVVGQFEIGN